MVELEVYKSKKSLQEQYASHKVETNTTNSTIKVK